MSELQNNSSLARVKQIGLRFLETHFVRIILALLICFLVFALLCPFDTASWMPLGVVVVGAICAYPLLRHEYRHFPVFLFIGSLVLYLGLVYALQTPPVSDFEAQYKAAILIIEGTTNPFDGMWKGLTGWTIAMVPLLNIWRSIACVKIFECFCTSLSAVLLYRILSHCFNARVAQCGSLGYALFPTVALMPSVLSNQVLSSTLCLLAFSVVCVNKPTSIQKTILRFGLAGVLLAFAKFIRPDVAVVAIALAIAALACRKWWPTASRIWHRVLGCASVGLCYVLVSTLLVMLIPLAGISMTGVVDDDMLWKLACGTDNGSSGQWDEQLYERIDNYVAEGFERNDAKWMVIQENLSDPFENVETVLKKNSVLWWSDTLSFALAAKDTTVPPSLYAWLISLDRSIALCLIVLSVLFLAKFIRQPRELHPIAFAFALALLGFIAALQIIEVQPRYLYTAYASLFVLATGGLSIIEKTYHKRITDNHMQQ